MAPFDASDETPVFRNDGVDKVTGAARYTFDFGLEGMLHAKVLRSPHAHARIKAIDTSAAEALPGVVTVVTGQDTAGWRHTCYGVGIRDQPVICTDKVRFVGDMVAAVAAKDERTALRALDLIKVDYEVLKPVMSIDEALAPGAPLIFEEPSEGEAMKVGRDATSVKEPAPNVLYEFGYKSGDCDALFKTAAHVFTDTFEFSRINHFHLEPHVNVARVTGDKIELWSCNQDPFVVRTDLVRIFNKPINQVCVYASYVGGGFGGKSFSKMEPLTVLLAMKARRPVRLALSLDESIITLTKHAARLTLTTAVTADGTLLARRSRILLDAGSYSDASAMTAVKAGYRIPGPYRWLAIDTVASAVRTTSVPGGSFRGFGGTQASFASESQMDMIARRLGMEPYDFRRKNFLKTGEQFRPGDSGMDSDLGEGLELVAQTLGYHQRKAGDGKGMGMAVGFKDGGGTGNHARAVVKVSADGHIFVHAGTVEIGQGAITAMSLIAAEELKLPVTSVIYGSIDTDHTPLNNGTHVSCGTTVTGLAVQRAAVAARDQVMQFAAEQLGCKVSDLRLEAGWAVQKGNERIALQPMITKYYGGTGYEFIGEGSLKVPYDPGAPLNAVNMFWIASWAGAEVDVDRETGKITVTRLFVVGDAGRALHKASCHGQIEGAAIQAYGQTLFEELKYTGEDPANATPMAYKVATVADLPASFGSAILEHGMGPGPYKLKGIGESGMLAISAAICNAVEDAIGVRVASLPLTPEKVLAAIDAKAAATPAPVA